VLTDIIGQDNLAVEVNRIVEHSEPKNTHIQDDKFNDTADEAGENNSDDDSWQEDDEVDWEKEKTTPVIEDVEWDTIIEVD
jgi:hypothetical protein